MSREFLLDTDTLSDLVRNPSGRVAVKISDIGEGSIATSVFVAAELRYGATRRGSARLTRRIDDILMRLEILPFESPADQIYASSRCALERAGMPIGANDLFIASHALALNLSLVTHNTREFARVPELRVVDWLA